MGKELPKILFSFDDGYQLDFEVARLLEKHGFRGIFYITTIGELTDTDVKRLHDAGHTIGGHTLTHPPDMKLLSYDDQLEEIKRNRDVLSLVIGAEVTLFAYPKGKYNDTTIQAAKDAGIEQARTVNVGNVTVPIDPYRYHTTVHIHPTRAEYKGQRWLEYAKEKFYKAVELGEKGYFHCWGHANEIEKFGLWGDFEELLIFIRKHIDNAQTKGELHTQGHTTAPERVRKTRKTHVHKK